MAQYLLVQARNTTRDESSMLLKVKIFNFGAKQRMAVVHPETAKNIQTDYSQLIKISCHQKDVQAQMIVSNELVQPDEIALSVELRQELEVDSGDFVNVTHRRRPQSLELIHQKRSGTPWSQADISAIVDEMKNGLYTDIELAYFTLTSMYVGLNMEEMVDLTKAVAHSGRMLSFDEPAYDKHSIGGIPGNTKVSLVIVPIVASAGLLIPKTSSRAITSPSGTADTFNVLADVKFEAEEVLEIAPRVRGMIFWGKPLNLAPLDDVLIEKVKHPLGLDPMDQMLSAIVAKKIAMGIDHMVWDLPVGKEAKLTSRSTAIEIGNRTVELCRKVGIEAEAALTYGEQPLGHGIGPALEAREALQVLQGKGATSTREKCLEIAGILLELGGKAPSGKGADLAAKILTSGKALTKMKEMVAAQGGEENISPEKIAIGSHSATLHSTRDGYVIGISNHAITRIARLAGCPSTLTAGVYLHKKLGDFVENGDPLLTIYSESETKLSEAMALAESINPISIEGAIIARIKGTT